MVSNREKIRQELEAERLRDELVAREAEDQAPPRIVLRPGERVRVRLVDETGKGNFSIEVETHDE